MVRIYNQLPTYDTALAQQYRDAARTELRAAGVTFPIKALMPYNSSGTEWAERVQVVKQNIERVLGSDFIELVIYNAPPTNFLGDNRRNGRFAFLECNWGPDYSDPETFSDPFNTSGTYNRPHMATNYTEANGRHAYINLLNEAKAEKTDLAKRFELFAKAEAYLIDEAFIIPYARIVPGWVASYLNPFDSNFSSGSMSYSKLNNVRKLDKPIGAEEFNRLQEQWEREREAALRASR
jgi:oligopeptide transport system substrate-binding protein